MNSFHRFCCIATLAMTALISNNSLATQTKTNAWEAYNAQSIQLQQNDHQAFLQELAQHKIKKARSPNYAKEFGFDPKPTDAFLVSEEGRTLLSSIISYQTPSGGWSKRTDMRTQREKGMRYGTEKKYVPTFDNNATITQLELLGRAFKLTQNPDYQQAFTRGLELVLIAQAPNGGWPQNYPLMGGYHDYLTFNDALMANILKLLHAVNQQQFGENLLDSTTMGRVEQSFIKALDCVLQTQVVQAGRKTIWAGQYDPFTLKPAKARAYEMASLASAESVGIVEVLMSLDTPSEALQEATHTAIDWFKASAIKNTEWERGTANLIPKKGAPDLWARFYDLSTNQPIFGDRDDRVHTDIKQVSQERLKGYAWYTTSPNKLIKHYEKWAQKFPRKHI